MGQGISFGGGVGILVGIGTGTYDGDGVWMDLIAQPRAARGRSPPSLCPMGYETTRREDPPLYNC